MTLDAIRKSILSEAEEKASAIDSEAGKEVSRIVKEAEEKAKQIVKSAQADAEKEAERLRKEANASAETEANSMLLEARGSIIERSLKDVMDDVESELSKGSMEKIFKQGMKQFSDIAGEHDLIIKTSKKNEGMARAGGNKVEVDSINGFIFSTSDGKIALNATIESIAMHETDQARRFIADELFGKRSGEKVRMRVAVKAKMHGAKKHAAVKKKKRG
jgi:vacuolar-type H+-ATPase subunit E/Vma4